MRLSDTRPLSVALIALTTLSLIACGSGPHIERHEDYSGPPTIAINPVSEGRAVATPVVSRWWVQKLLTDALDPSDGLAGAIALPTASAANEATVIVDVSLTALEWEGAGRHSGAVSLRVRSRDKETGRIGIDSVYIGRCERCRVPTGSPPVAGPLGDLTSDLARDLARRHRG